MKKLFYLLLCLPLAFAACQPEEPGTENKVYNLTLTSESVLNFEAEGGQGVITFNLAEVTRTTLEPQPQVEATCAAAWVTQLRVAENITFNVAANDGDARETKVVVKYGEQSFEVSVTQEAKMIEPAKDVEFTAQMLVGEYFGDYYAENVGNYFVTFTDNGYNEDGDILDNSTYYQLDLYGVMYEGDAVDGCVTIPVGTYTLDLEDTMAIGTISNESSSLIITGEGESESYAYDAAELVVAENGSYELNVTIEGVKHIVTFSGESKIVDKRENNQGAEEVKMSAAFSWAIYYGDQYNPGVSDNFYLFLSDVGVDADGWELPNGIYYRFDLYSELLNTEDGLTIPYGTYTLDDGTMNPFTITIGGSQYYILDEYAWDYTTDETPISGTVVIDEKGINAHILINDCWHTVTYEGAITIDDMSSGGDDGGDDGPYSTLWEDVRCNFDDHKISYEYYSDWYEVGYMNWTFEITPNDGAGDFVQFDILAGSSSTTNFFGEYTIADTYEEYTSFTGYFDWDGAKCGSWYYTDGGDVAPFVDGTLSVVDNGDGTVTIEFDVYDDCDNNITGSWTGVIEQPTRSTSLKQSNVSAKRKITPMQRALINKKGIYNF